MRLFPGQRPLLLLLFAVLSDAVCTAVSPDPRILSLVPPGAEVVAGMGASSGPEHSSDFLVVDHNNIVDLNDFYALTGVDSAQVIREIIFVAAAAGKDRLVEHSLLVSGSFDQARIYKSSIENGAALEDYGKIRVVVVQPFARERSNFNDVRWLAILDSHILIFGTIESVRQEIDRYLTHNKADSSLLEKLDRLRRDDETWCVLTIGAQNSKVKNVLMALDPKLAELAGKGDTFQFGIRYGRYIEFEYEITTASSHTALAMSSWLTQSFAGLEKESALLRRPEAISEGTTVHGVIKISMSRYNAWLTEVLARGRGRNAVLP